MTLYSWQHEPRVNTMLVQNVRKMCQKAEEFTVADPLMASTGKTSTKAFTKDEARGFKEILPDIVRELTFDGPYNDIPMVSSHIAKCLQYNLLGGKMDRGIAVPISFKILAPPEEHTQEKLKMANILGWCIELMQTVFFLADDIMDNAEVRRGKSCWHKKDNIGMIAFNDAVILETCIYSLLNKHFKDHKHYAVLANAFLETTRHTAIGHSMDMLSKARQNEGAASNFEFIDHFNMKLYNNIVKHKTSFHTFYLPVQSAMLLADIDDPILHHQALAILLEIGKFFQVQDDYLDCFGDPKRTGKVGEDIKDGKCSWLIVMALQRANPKQKEELKKYYGSSNAEDVANVKAIYDELNLPKLFYQYEEEAYNGVLNRIGQMSGGRWDGQSNRRLSREVFYYFLDKIYKKKH